MMKNYEDMMKFNKDAIDLMVKSGTKFATGYEAITKEAMSFYGKSFEDAVEASKAMASCKTAADVMSLQSKLGKDAWEAAVAQSKKLGEMQAELVKEAIEPIGSHYKGAIDGVMKTA